MGDGLFKISQFLCPIENLAVADLETTLSQCGCGAFEDQLFLLCPIENPAVADLETTLFQ